MKTDIVERLNLRDASCSYVENIEMAMKTDIVERLNLRDASCSYVENIYKDAAAEILRLRAENEKLRAALKIVAGMANGEYIADEQIRAARAAYLGEKDD